MQICTSDESIIGTGFLVSSDPWLVLTCEHVAAAAGVTRESPADARLVVRFPEPRPASTRLARVVGRLDPKQDDAVLLSLEPPEPPAQPEWVLPLIPADNTDDHRFKAYGFRKLDKYAGGIADGKIQGAIPVPEELDLVCDLLQIESDQINRGMSGAPLLDLDTNQLVAMVTETYFPPEGSPKDQSTAWAIDGRILESFQPAAAPREVARPAMEGPKVGGPLAPRRQLSEWALHGAPPPTERFVNRETELAWLDERLRPGEASVAYVTGVAGQGKTALVRHWVESLREREQPPETVFWWGFSELPSPEQFFSAALDHFSGGGAPKSFRTGAARTLGLAAYVAGARALLVLDAIGVPAATGDDAADELRILIDTLTHTEGLATTVVINRPPIVPDVSPVLEVGPLAGDVAVRLLEDGGVEPDLARAIAERVTSPLALELAAADPRAAEAAAHPALAAEPSLGQVLRETIGLLSRDARRFLHLASLLRHPLPREWAAALGPATAAAGVPIEDVSAAIGELEDIALVATVEREGRPCLSLHPAVRELSEVDRAADPLLHVALADVWWDHRAGIDEPAGLAKSVQELQPAIESVHHLCAAQRYELALARLWEGVYRRERFVLVNQLGEWALDLEIVREFFPNGDLGLNPMLDVPEHRGFVLNEAAHCVRMLGNPGEAVPLFARAGETAVGKQFVAVIVGMSETYLELGQTTTAEEAARDALARATEIEGDPTPLAYAHATLARPLAVQGALAEALEQYGLAESVADGKPVDGLHAVEHATTLWWNGGIDACRRVLERELERARGELDREATVNAERLLGELTIAESPGDPAAVQPLAAVAGATADIVASLPRIEALTSYGAALAAHAGASPGRLSEAEETLAEALRLTADSAWLFYEPPIRIGLARVAFLRSDDSEATAHLQRAMRLAEESGNALDLARIERLRQARSESYYPLAPAPLPGR
ncbi:MAG: trypsin-like peptidase domain-containing protein [Actinomycetota bacterium]|nr:trypsin-like peptidase domain-containing protein [Actinomycetota bacterium]